MLIGDLQGEGRIKMIWWILIYIGIGVVLVLWVNKLIWRVAIDKGIRRVNFLRTFTVVAWPLIFLLMLIFTIYKEDQDA